LLGRENQFSPLFSRATTPQTRSKKLNNAFHKFATVHKPYNSGIAVTQEEKRNTQVNPSFPYLERASQMTRIRKTVSTTAPGTT